MIIHPGAGAQSGTMVAALLDRFGGEEGLSTVGGPLRPGIIHRLDKETSGAVVIARNDDAHKKLVEEFQNREVQKTYLALLHGKLKGEKGTIDLPVARDVRRRTRMTARRREGREARTDWRVKLRMDGFTFGRSQPAHRQDPSNPCAFFDGGMSRGGRHGVRRSAARACGRAIAAAA